MFKTWLVIFTWLILTGAAATGIYAALHATPGIIGPEDSGLDVVQIVLAVMAGLGAVLLGVYAYRRQRLQEVASARDDQAQFLERYNAATSQLADDKAAARLAGIYAMARLADDWPDQRQQCVDVLCAYLRMPPAAVDGDNEARTTIARVIVDHLRKDNPGVSWSGLDFNFDRAQFHNLDMSRVVFNGHKVTFQGAEFSGSTTFENAVFDTDLYFDDATFTGSHLTFTSATFQGAESSFLRTTFNSGSTFFILTKFAGNRTSFILTTFKSDALTFQGSRFDGPHTLFLGATFYSDPDFSRAAFNGTTEFKQSRFAGDRATFDEAIFNGKSHSFKDVFLHACHMTFDNVPAKENTSFTGLETASLFEGSKITKNGRPFKGWNRKS